LEDKKQYEILVKEWVIKCEDFCLAKLSMDWSPRRRSSRGGWYDSAGGPGINMAMSLYFGNDKLPISYSYEYASFDKHPVIGGFYYTKDSKYLRGAMVVCHEMAHAAQFYSSRQLYKQIDRPHGESFKQPYSTIRINLFNYLIPKNQHELASKYNEMLKIKNAKQFIEWEHGLQIS
jgi:hypothetical protein